MAITIDNTLNPSTTVRIKSITIDNGKEQYVDGELSYVERPSVTIVAFRTVAIEGVTNEFGQQAYQDDEWVTSIKLESAEDLSSYMQLWSDLMTGAYTKLGSASNLSWHQVR